MILAGDLIIIIGIYTKYVSERKVIKSELHPLLWHLKKYVGRGEPVEGEVVQQFF